MPPRKALHPPCRRTQLRHSCQAVVFDEGPISQSSAQKLSLRHAPVNIAHRSQAAAHYQAISHTRPPPSRRKGPSLKDSSVCSRKVKFLFSIGPISMFFGMRAFPAQMSHEHAFDGPRCGQISFLVLLHNPWFLSSGGPNGKKIWYNYLTQPDCIRKETVLIWQDITALMFGDLPQPAFPRQASPF